MAGLCCGSGSGLFHLFLTLFSSPLKFLCFFETFIAMALRPAGSLSCKATSPGYERVYRETHCPKFSGLVLFNVSPQSKELVEHSLVPIWFDRCLEQTIPF